MNSADIRAANMDDIGGLTKSCAELFAEDGAARDRLRNSDWAEQHGKRWCEELVTDPEALVLVATTDAAVIGHLIGTLSEASPMWLGPRAELVSMHVDPAFRRRGVGDELVGRFRDWARSRGAARMQVTAYLSNEGAVNLYTKHGFEGLSLEMVADL